MNHRQYQAEYFIDHKYIVIRCCRIKPLAKFLHQTAISSLVSACFLGVGALGCWGVEMIASNSGVINPFYWQARKHICVGGALLALSGCAGSVLVSRLCNKFER